MNYRMHISARLWDRPAQHWNLSGVLVNESSTVWNARSLVPHSQGQPRLQSWLTGLGEAVGSAPGRAGLATVGPHSESALLAADSGFAGPW